MTNNQLIQLINAIENADSSERLLKAVEALADARLEAGIPTLITVLGYNNPGAAVAAVDGLVQLGEAAILPLLNLLDEYNYGARAWAIRALAGIGDPRGLETLLKAAETDFALSVRRAAAKGLGNLQWIKMAEEEIQPAQKRVFNTLVLTCQDPEWVVRYAAVVGLQNLATAVAKTQSDLFLQIISHFEEILNGEVDVAVSTRIQLGLAQLAQISLTPF
ncbi:MAG TPA: phycobilisome maturation protein [Cyanobacteria bacterium UBA11149]|nr:phycobilisome maturation protein [Cyanobacteria bacterium UBA11367]HBE58288.1 phycobilisome maturation protein [Cyanobacteria bacterium UBA11366]HBK64366.1 phycobilisome maturation protein [Cyanobacteria bacterium UBA11166]HBR73017.1 phycobilisome maturation protein [Cyanobacteria bacterium UBA11159]HBS68897.1 phycobilisome maturation protein [Cyanobacteria bacterium UBA11153]HBW88164.1 phycobilisome maturation protein [Cyanobacteria bacterium UBA11149]HCA97207.1 phycobilisome maturation p